jgi:aspartate carbamoyltransferase regulatory subunit
MKDRKQLSVSAIKDGTVIDHIPSQCVFKVIDILGLQHLDHQVTFGINLESKRLGKKGIIKISGKFFEEEEINKIALIAPLAKINVIRDYVVVEKRPVVVPDEIIGIARCVNPNCITNVEKVRTKFRVVSKPVVSLKCHYCEKITDQEHLVIL